MGAAAAEACKSISAASTSARVSEFNSVVEAKPTSTPQPILQHNLQLARQPYVRRTAVIRGFDKDAVLTGMALSTVAGGHHSGVAAEHV